MFINWIKYKNFKGLIDFELRPEGKSISIFAANHKGKSTTYDGFLWLLFGRDSRGQADFPIKTISITGEHAHNLEHSVEAEFDMNGKTITLQRVFTEKYTKRHGKARAEFTGHTTSYAVDGTPKQEKEYKEIVASICDEKIFRLLTSYSHFNDDTAFKEPKLPAWQKRRNLLFDVAGGDVSDEDVCASDNRFTGFMDTLNGKSIDDFRKTIKSRQAAINKELSSITPRIDENNLKLNKDLRPKAQIEKDLKAATDKHKTISDQISQIESGGEIALKSKELTQAEADLQAHKNAVAADRQKQEDENREKRKVLQFEVDNAERAVGRKTQDIDDLRKSSVSLQNSISTIQSDMGKLRIKWHEINTEQFTGLLKEPDICPSCGQKIPEEQVNAAREKAQQAFNQQKADRLKENVGRGTKLKTELESVRSTLQKNETEIHDAESILDNLKQDLEKARKALKDFDDKTSVAHESADPKSDRLQSSVDVIKKEIEDLKVGTAPSTEKQKAELSELDATIESLNSDLNSHKTNQNAEVRIVELKEQEKSLAAEYEKLDGQLFLSDEFIRAKAALLDDKINSKFKRVRFVLFEELIGEGIKEVCITTMDGKPWSVLSTSERIEAGLDIISAMQEFYNFRPCVFIDNKESISELPKMDCQVISLVVSPEDSNLRVERAA